MVYHNALCLTEFLSQYFIHSPWMVKKWLDARRLQNTISNQNAIPKAVPPSFTVTLRAMTENVSHWTGHTRHSQKQKLLWIATDRKENNSRIADALSKLLVEKGFGPLQVDVGCQRTVLLPLIHSLEQFPSYRAELVRLSRIHGFFCLDIWAGNIAQGPGSHRHLVNSIERLLVKPLHRIHWQTKFQSLNSGLDRQTPRRKTLIINSARLDQAGELHSIIEAFKDFPQFWDIIVIGQPDLLRDFGFMTHHHVSTLYHCDNGSSMYSESNPAAPHLLYKNLSLLLLEALWCAPDEHSQRIWTNLCELRPLISGSEGKSTPTDIFRILHRASDDLKWMVKSLYSLGRTPYPQVQKCLKKDNIVICRVIQLLFEIDSYKSDIQRIPHDQAFAVLNLIHSILDSGLPNDSSIKNDNQFIRRSHCLLRFLAGHLNHLPEKLEVRDVVLLEGHAVKYGGFAEIYHGKYTKDTGERVEVALKVLKIFHDQSDSNRRILHQKFTREVLAWSCLKRVDSLTFPGHTIAMVSQWMAHGSVLSYMLENSPCSVYAIHLIHDVIMAVSYLHSVNIVHGDLCGVGVIHLDAIVLNISLDQRNILINEEGRACLTDFGLAMFIDQETAIKSSTRSGSARWMAPELLLHDIYYPGRPFRRTIKSDVWAFACVCCEIWSEGTNPFAGMCDGGVIIAFSTSETDGETQVLPYTSRPVDKGGRAMPQRLWELVQSCWKRDVTLRPTVQDIADVVSEISAQWIRRVLPAEGLYPDNATATIDSLVSPLSVQRALRSPGPGVSRHRCTADHATVHLGPVPADQNDAEVQFHTILNPLLDAIPRRDIIVPPHFVSWHDSRHLALCFTFAVEANSFALTWMVYRFAPYENVVARLVAYEQ